MAHLTSGDRHKQETSFYKKHFKKDALWNYKQQQKKFTERALQRQAKEKSK